MLVDEGFEQKLMERYLKSCLSILPRPYESQDSVRTTILYFVTSSLDVLGFLDSPAAEARGLMPPDLRATVIEWLYAMHIPRPTHEAEDEEHAAPRWGFRGSPFLGLPWHVCGQDEHQHAAAAAAESDGRHEMDCAHLATTYTALCTLRVLGDDFSRLDRAAILSAIKHLQQPDGSFSANVGGSESDVRFIYCAAAICYMLQEWSFDVPKAVRYILSSQTYEYAMAQGPGQEAHGGSTYCSIATLVLTGFLDHLPHQDKLTRWLLERQVTGFQGRVNKDADTCYSFWIGASLKMLDKLHLADYRLSKAFTMSCQTPIGGFGKCVENPPDVLHTYMALCGLSMMGAPGLRDIHCALGMTQRAAGGFAYPLRTARDALGVE